MHGNRRDTSEGFIHSVPRASQAGGRGAKGQKRWKKLGSCEKMVYYTESLLFLLFLTLSMLPSAHPPTNF